MEKNIIKSSFIPDLPYFLLTDFAKSFKCKLIKAKRIIYKNKECIMLYCSRITNIVPIRPFKLIFSDFELEKTYNNPGLNESHIEGLWRRMNSSAEYNQAFYENYLATQPNSNNI